MPKENLGGFGGQSHPTCGQPRWPRPANAYVVAVPSHAGYQEAVAWFRGLASRGPVRRTIASQNRTFKACQNRTFKNGPNTFPQPLARRRLFYGHPSPYHLLVQ